MTRVQWAAVWTVFVLGGLVFLGCGNRVEQNIEKLGGSQDDRERAKMELTLAKEDAIGPLIEALADTSRPPGLRVDVTDVLFRLYLRETDSRILEALIHALGDPERVVRSAVATALGYIADDKAASPMVDAVEKEQNDEVAYQILASLETLGMKTGYAQRHVAPEIFSQDDRQRFARILKRRSATGSQRLQRKVREWLEIIAEAIAQEADQLVLKADLQEAEERYFEAKDLVPDSKNINQKLGRFYYDNGDEQKGLDILTEHGMVAYAKRLSPAPVIDGVLDDPCWKQVKPFKRFYQCIFNMAAYPTEGKSEAYVGYTHASFFIAVRGYEPSTETMTAKVTERDGPVWMDDNVEIYLDTNHDYWTYYQIVINSLATVADVYKTHGASGGDWAWNGKY